MAHYNGSLFGLYKNDSGILTIPNTVEVCERSIQLMLTIEALRKALLFRIEKVRHVFVESIFFKFYSLTIYEPSSVILIPENGSVIFEQSDVPVLKNRRASKSYQDFSEGM